MARKNRGALSWPVASEFRETCRTSRLCSKSRDCWNADDSPRPPPLERNEMMAETRGIVQRIKLDPSFQDGYWVYIGPSPTNTTLFAVGIGDPDPQVLRRTCMAVL